MNSCVLMAQIISDPELRSTQDNTPVSSMLVEFESSKEGEAPGTVQVEGWGTLAEEIKSTYSNGDKIIIEGRLSMNLLEMPQGYKEKRAKLVASRIYPLNSSSLGNNTPSVSNHQSSQAPANSTSNVVDFAATTQAKSTPIPASTPSITPEVTPAGDNNEDWDEIPFLRPVYARSSFAGELWDFWELAANRYWDGAK